MIGTLKDLSYTRNGSTIVSFETRENVAEMFDELNGATVDIDIKKHYGKRTLDSNAYAWVLIDKIAEKMDISKTEVYREAIKEIGGVSTTACFPSKDAEVYARVWKNRGLGWQVDMFPSKLENCTNLVLYRGSSDYNGAEMSRLIHLLIQDAEALGIPTMTEEQVEKMVAQWATKKRREENDKTSKTDDR